MSGVHHLPKVEQVEEEASRWLARMTAEDVSDLDRTRFGAWRNAHPLNARTYDALAVTLSRFTAAGPLVRAVSLGQSLNETARVRGTRRWLTAAAVAASVVAVALGWFLLDRKPETMFQTAIGEQATISLPDGSTLDLNSGSLAHVEYSDKARVIRLERGEGFFNVAPDPSRPFWVGVGNSWARALGTSFNVYLLRDGVRVTVSEGKVKVTQAADRWINAIPSEDRFTQAPSSILSAGQQVELRSGSAAVRSLPPNEIDRSVAWRSGAVVFEKQALGDVVDELSRYTKLQLIVDDDRLRTMWVGGTFEANSQGVEAFIAMLQDGLQLSVRRDSDKVYIERAQID